MKQAAEGMPRRTLPPDPKPLPQRPPELVPNPENVRLPWYLYWLKIIHALKSGTFISVPMFFIDVQEYDRLKQACPHEVDPYQCMY
jgi:hypothetical protein